MSIVLSAQDIEDLTDRVRHSAQARQLAHLGIPCERRTDGSLVVLRVHVEAIVGIASRERDTDREPRLRFD